jgi:hypothetical protein
VRRLAAAALIMFAPVLSGVGIVLLVLDQGAAGLACLIVSVVFQVALFAAVRIYGRFAKPS